MHEDVSEAGPSVSGSHEGVKLYARVPSDILLCNCVRKIRNWKSKNMKEKRTLRTQVHQIHLIEQIRICAAHSGFVNCYYIIVVSYFGKCTSIA